MLLIILGIITAVAGRHSVFGLALGITLMFAGWIRMEWKEAVG